MKKLLFAGFVTGVSMLLALSAVLAASATKAKAVQREFLDHVEMHQTDDLLKSMHPALRDQIDRPLLHDMIGVINERLGPATSITSTGIDVKKDSRGTQVSSESKIRFEKGEATAKFVTLDGQLIEFNLVTPELKNWFSKPSSTELYEQLGEDFLRKWLGTEKDSAWEMMHPQLQKVVDHNQLGAMSKSVLERFGNVRSITCTGTRPGKASHAPNLFIDYDVQTDHANLKGEIEIQFDGLKGYLLGFKI